LTVVLFCCECDHSWEYSRDLLFRVDTGSRRWGRKVCGTCGNAGVRAYNMPEDSVYLIVRDEEDDKGTDCGADELVGGERAGVAAVRVGRRCR
jgi:hypothetical protein